jgi:hypothetical protein
VIPLLVFLLTDKNCTDLNFSHFFCELGLKMLGTQQWQLLHVEKDDQVIRHNNNNNKTWETKEKSIRKAFLFKIFVICYYLTCMTSRPPKRELIAGHFNQLKNHRCPKSQQVQSVECRT